MLSDDGYKPGKELTISQIVLVINFSRHTAITFQITA